LSEGFLMVTFIRKEQASKEKRAKKRMLECLTVKLASYVLHRFTTENTQCTVHTQLSTNGNANTLLIPLKRDDLYNLNRKRKALYKARVGGS
jgi:hypothetical protein